MRQIVWNIELHNGNGWGKFVSGIKSETDAILKLNEIRKVFLPSLRFRIIKAG